MDKVQQTERKNVPINKGNYASLESEERLQRFERLRGEDWPEDYRKYREEWTSLPKRQKVREYPLQVDLELSNRCNLKCPMCFRNIDGYVQKPNVIDMSPDLAKRIIDETGRHVPALRLSFRGECTLNPALVDIVTYAKKAGFGEVSFLTNGSGLTEKLIAQLVASGLDWMTVSVDGFGETYNRVRSPLVFEDTYAKIKKIFETKKKLNRHKPVIKVQTLWPAIRHDPQKFYDLFYPYVDLIAFNPIIDYLDNDSLDIIQFEENFCCPQHYQRLIIGADGAAICCTNDEFEKEKPGDANLQSIHEIWHGPELTRLRELHKQPNGFKKMEICRHCFLPRKVEYSEKATVNGREIAITNYTNRSQNIGE